MPKYVIERVIPGAGQLSPVELRTISKQSSGIVKELLRGNDGEISTKSNASMAVFDTRITDWSRSRSAAVPA